MQRRIYGVFNVANLNKYHGDNEENVSDWNLAAIGEDLPLLVNKFPDALHSILEKQIKTIL